MAEQQPANALGATFPAPPPFFQHFTPGNLERIAELRSAAEAESKKDHSSADAVPIRLLDLPAELRFLQPPQPPADGTWNCFGGRYFVSDSRGSVRRFEC